jgi:hypothetical protein
MDLGELVTKLLHWSSYLCLVGLDGPVSPWLQCMQHCVFWGGGHLQGESMLIAVQKSRCPAILIAWKRTQPGSS